MNTNDNPNQVPVPTSPVETAPVAPVVSQAMPAPAAPHLSAESQIAEVQVEAAPAVEIVPASTVENDPALTTLNTLAPEGAMAPPVENATVATSTDAPADTPVETGAAPTIARESAIEIDRPASGAETQNATPETVAPQTPVQQNAMPEALRALFPGAFLGGEWEVREVLARGATNLYRVSGGDYSAPENKLLAERASIPATPQAAPGETSNAGVPPVAATPETAQPDATQIADVPPVWDDVALNTNEIAALPDADSSGAAGSNSTVLVAPIKTFSQDERDYQLFEWFDSTSLQDWREPTNDTRLLHLLAPLARFLGDCATRNEQADISTETLRVDAKGDLKFVGFAAPRTSQSGDANLAALRQITNFLLKHVVAESATMRLDDRFAGLALSDEVKDLARRLDDDAPDAFMAIGEAVTAIETLAGPVEVLDAALLSDKGRERDHNEDAGMIVRSQRAALLNSYERELYIVSDGMGGHEGGEVASDLTMSSLVQNLDALQIDWNDNVVVRASLIEVIDAVNAEVVALTETPKYRASRAKPGATLTFALRLGARVFLGNVGDSRAYIVRDGVLQRATKDHSYVQNLVDRGEITDDEAWEHPEGSIITAHIGYAKLKTRDIFIRLVRRGDKLVIVSDGVVDMLRDRDIAPHLQGTGAAQIVKSLVDASNAAGGADNITAVCVIF